ncbi:MAG TPA: hypothetical protein VD947_01290 [Patescibacteria group bacterium]|nr:hypothetical protein [Patescibacteria group bacterium]
MARASVKIVVVPKEFETRGEPPWEYYLAHVDRPERTNQTGDQPSRKDDKKDDTPKDRVQETGEIIGKVLNRG